MAVAALDGIRVVDLSSGIAGPLASAILADFGADVVKVEPPDGDPARSLPGFAAWNRGKKSVVADLSARADREHLADLVARADILVTSSGPEDPGGVLPATGAANPGLIHLSMPPYLGPAPWAGASESDPLLSAWLGTSSRQSSFSGDPVDLIYPHSLYEQAIWAAAAVVAALIERENSGRGQTVTVSGAHGNMVLVMPTLLIDMTEPNRATNVGSGGTLPTYSRYRCADGEWVFLAALGERFQLRAFDVLGTADITDDPRLGGDLGRIPTPACRDWVRERLAAAFATRSRDFWLAALEAADCPACPVLDRDDWMDHPQVRALGLVAEVADPERGPVVMPNVPVTLSQTPARVQGAAPELGQHTWNQLGWPERTPASAGQGGGRRPGGPLAGVKVLNLGTVLAGPYTGMLLAELGADVVKVEPPAGDLMPRVSGFNYNRGMRAIVLDMSKPEGRDVCYQLVRSVDVVVDNYRPGVVNRLGVDYATLKKINPEIITLSISGFGDRGPLGGRAGFDPVLQAMSGMMSAQGGDDEPVFLTAAVNDVTAAATSVLGICVALFARLRGSGGQQATTTLAGISMFMQSGELVRFAGRPPSHRGGRDFAGPTPLDRMYQVADGYVRIQAADLAQLSQAGLAVDAGLSEDDLTAEIARGLAGMTAAEAVAALTAAGAPAAKARSYGELVGDPLLRESGFLEEHVRLDDGLYYLPGRFAQFSQTKQTRVLVAPGIGEHTRAVLSEAGYAEEDIDKLVNLGIVKEGEPFHFNGRISYR